jgi:Ca2+-binding EF-hand superfamily protein
MSILFYIYSCVGIELITKRDWSYDKTAEAIIEYKFSSLYRFMMTLIQFTTFDSIADIYTPIMLAEPLVSFFFVSYMLIVGIALMNLLTAIIVEGSMEQSRNDLEVAAALKDEMMKKYLPRLYQVFMEIDADGSGSLDLEELMNAPESVRQELNKLVNTDDMEEIFHILDMDGSGSIDIDEFFDGISKIVTGKEDMPQLRLIKLITTSQRKHSEEFEAMNEKVDRLYGLLGSLTSSPPTSGASPRVPPEPSFAPVFMSDSRRDGRPPMEYDVMEDFDV